MADLKYVSIPNIIRRLAGRITILETDVDSSITGITGTQIGTDLIEIIAEEVEEFMDMYLGMIYILPLKLHHPFLSGVADRLVIAQVYESYFPTQMEGGSSDSAALSWRQQALNDFQSLFNGLGIFVSGASDPAAQIQNDEMRQQMQNRAVILKGETLKRFIGHDVDSDNISDTDLFKLNSNVPPSFYTTGDFEGLDEGYDVINNIRVKPRNHRHERVEVDFYGF